MPNDSILIQPIIEEDINVGVGEVEVAAPSGGILVGHKVNIGSFAIVYYYTWAAGTIAANDVATQTFQVDGAALGFPVLPTINANLGPGVYEIDARVSAPNTVRLSIFNRAATPVTLNTLTGTILVFPINTEA